MVGADGAPPRGAARVRSRDPARGRGSWATSSEPKFLARCSSATWEAELDALLAAGLVAERAGGAGLRASALRQVAYEQVSRETRRALHRRIAEPLRGSGAEPEPTLAIAHHLLEAGGDGDATTLRTFWSAGLQAHRVADWRGAIRLFHAAISLARKLSVPRAQLGWLQYWAGRAHQNDDDTPAGVELLREVAAAIGKAEGDLELWARAVHGAASHDSGDVVGRRRAAASTHARARGGPLSAVGSGAPGFRASRSSASAAACG